MNNFYTEEIESIIARSHQCETPEKEIFGVICCLGRDAENGEEFRYAYDLLLKLCSHHNADVRAYSILGLSLLGSKAPLDKATLTGIIHREWATAEGLRKGWISDAVDDMNFFLGWNIHLE